MNSTNNDLKVKLSSEQGGTFTLDRQPRLLVDDFVMLKQAIVDGLGIAVLPDYMSRKEVASGQLVNILPSWSMAAVDVYALYPKNRAKIPKVKAFLEFVSELYGDTLNK
jgi:LysR family transcriptional regulator AphB